MRRYRRPPRRDYSGFVEVGKAIQAERLEHDDQDAPPIMPGSWGRDDPMVPAAGWQWCERCGCHMPVDASGRCCDCAAPEPRTKYEGDDVYRRVRRR